MEKSKWNSLQVGEGIQHLGRGLVREIISARKANNGSMVFSFNAPRKGGTAEMFQSHAEVYSAKTREQVQEFNKDQLAQPVKKKSVKRVSKSISKSVNTETSNDVKVCFVVTGLTPQPIEAEFAVSQ